MLEIELPQIICVDEVCIISSKHYHNIQIRTIRRSIIKPSARWIPSLARSDRCPIGRTAENGRNQAQEKCLKKPHTIKTINFHSIKTELLISKCSRWSNLMNLQTEKSPYLIIHMYLTMQEENTFSESEETKSPDNLYPAIAFPTLAVKVNG